MTTHARRLAGMVLCLALVASMLAAPAAAHGEQRDELLVDVDASGDAEVYLILTYELDRETEREAFREFRENTTAQEAAAERFENRMSAVAADASDATGREMSVADADVELLETVDHGVMTLEVSWTNLAAVDGDRLTVTEPFASGFETEVAFTLAIPQGYERVSSTPEPSTSTRETATWDPDADLGGFEVVAEPVATETEDDGAGFGVAIALGALLGGALLASRSESVAV